jgi:hypothetical protein
MTFECTDRIGVRDLQRGIRIQSHRVAGPHLIDGEKDKWQFFLHYALGKMHFACVNFVLHKYLPYVSTAGKDQLLEYNAIIIVPRDQLIAFYGLAVERAGLRAPTSGDMNQLFADIQEAFVALARYRARNKPDGVDVPDPKVIFVEHVGSDGGQVAKMLDEFAAEEA